MNRLFRSAVLSATLAGTALTPLGQALAGPRHDPAYRQDIARQSDAGDVLVAGLLGAAIGAVVVGALTAEDHPEGENPYRHPRPSIDRELFFGNLFDEPAPDPAVIDYDGGDSYADHEYDPYGDGSGDDYAYYGDDGSGDDVYDDGDYGDDGYDQVTYLYEPWTRDWYRYCARTYDTFDPHRGTYVDESGTEQFCVADH